MPCNSGPTDREISTQNRIAVEKANKHIQYLEACLCALLTEMFARNEDEAESIILSASENGQVDIPGFWVEHRERDRNRLLRDLDKYSEQEKALILKLLQKK